MILSNLRAEAPSPRNRKEISQTELLVLLHSDPWISEFNEQLSTAAASRKNGVPHFFRIKGHGNNSVDLRLTFGHHVGYGAIFRAHSGRGINAYASEYCALLRSKARGNT